jgi:hypothetical protein
MATSQEDVVRRVQALWAKADDPAASPHEKEAAIAKARELMAKWAIDEIVLSEASPTHEEVIIADILMFEEDDEDETLVPDQRMILANYIVRNHRCKCVMTWKDAGIYADGSAQVAGRYMLVFGFRSDVRMVEVMYTALMSDMIVAFYRTNLRHVKRKKDRESIMVNFCEGYVHRIGKRLADVNREIHKMAETDGSLLPVLRNREAAVTDKFDEMFPPDSIESVAVKGFKYDPNAQAAGAAAAERADLGGKKVGRGVKGALES